MSDDYAGYGEVLEGLTQELAAARRERDLALTEVRIREGSQIPMIPRGAAEKMTRLEAELAAARRETDTLREALLLAKAHGGLPPNITATINDALRRCAECNRAIAPTSLGLCRQCAAVSAGEGTA